MEEGLLAFEVIIASKGQTVEERFGIGGGQDGVVVLA